MRTHYENLQVIESASQEVIKGAYKHLSQKWHPDKHSQNRDEAERICRIINEAYEVLSNEEAKRQYDLRLKERRKINGQNNNNKDEHKKEYVNKFSDFHVKKHESNNSVVNNSKNPKKGYYYLTCIFISCLMSYFSEDHIVGAIWGIFFGALLATLAYAIVKWAKSERIQSSENEKQDNVWVYAIIGMMVFKFYTAYIKPVIHEKEKIQTVETVQQKSIEKNEKQTQSAMNNVGNPVYRNTQFVLLKLPYNVQIEIPRNWEALSNNQRITLDSAVQSRSAGVFDVSSDLNFGANYYDDKGRTAAILNSRYYPDLDVSQEEARVAEAAEIRELDAALYESLVKAGQVSGFSILVWNGTSRREINGNTVFVTEYKRSPLNNNGNFKVRLVRVFNGSKSFTLTVSYREDQEYLLRPICDRIISSLRN